MTAYVFAGPTLAAEVGRTQLDAVFLPPVGQGDVYRVARTKPRAIGIVDGYFERVAAVWHKEILWAMAQGVHVFGSASMGALRAAELAPFGMQGVGAIYEQLRDGDIEDDDEVAVVHGPAETGYRALSEAMVNIRATLAVAADRGVISVATQRALAGLAKGMFYAERCYPAVLARAVECGLPRSEIDELRAFLPRGRVDQKHRDALAMLTAMRAHLARAPGPLQVDYWFAYTDAWQQFVDQVDRNGPERNGSEYAALSCSEASRGDGNQGSVSDDDLREELALSAAYESAQQGALLRARALAEAQRHGVVVTEDMLAVEAKALRDRHGLAVPADLVRWMVEQGLDWDGLATLLEEQAQLRWVCTVFAADASRALGNHLRATGEYRELVQAVRAKRAVLVAAGCAEPSLADLNLTEDELWTWYFEQHRQRSRPADLARYARKTGFASRDAMRRAVLRAYCVARQRSPAGE